MMHKFRLLLIILTIYLCGCNNDKVNYGDLVGMQKGYVIKTLEKSGTVKNKQQLIKKINKDIAEFASLKEKVLYDEGAIGILITKDNIVCAITLYLDKGYSGYIIGDLKGKCSKSEVISKLGTPSKEREKSKSIFFDDQIVPAAIIYKRGEFELEFRLNDEGEVINAAFRARYQGNNREKQDDVKNNKKRMT